MIYVLFIIGIILIAYGLYIMKNDKLERGETFKGIVVEKEKDDSTYIGLLATNQELTKKVNNIDNRMAEITNGFMDIRDMLERFDQGTNTNKDIDEDSNAGYGEVAHKIDRMLRANMTVDEIATDLNIGKGEVLLIEKLLQK